MPGLQQEVSFLRCHPAPLVPAPRYAGRNAPNKLNPLRMLRDDDEMEPEYDCPQCGRSFSAFSRLDEHMAQEHASPRQCQQCGKLLRDDEYHRC